MPANFNIIVSYKVKFLYFGVTVLRYILTHFHRWCNIYTVSIIYKLSGMSKSEKCLIVV